MNVRRQIWIAAAALNFMAGTAFALSPTTTTAYCYTCIVSPGDSSCTVSVYGWTNYCSSGLRFYMSTSLTGGSLGAPQPLFVFKDGQVMRMPNTPATVAAPPPPPSLSLGGGGGGGETATTATNDLFVRPLPSIRAAAGDANRARCAALASDGKVTSSELTAWQRFNCMQYYN